MFKCGDRVIVKSEHGAYSSQVGTCLGETYKARYETMVMVQFNLNGYYYSTWVKLKDLYCFVVLCAGIL